MNKARIPLDVMDLIIDEVSSIQDYHRMPTLKALALTCRDFVKPAQRRMFREIKLHASASTETYSRLFDVINGNPELALYVKVFCIEEDSASPSFYTKFITQPTLPKLLKYFRNLTEFGLFFQKHHASWERVVSWELHLALGDIFLSPTFQRLSLVDIIHLPFDAAGWFAVIPNLYARSALFRGGLEHRVPRLENLTIDADTIDGGYRSDPFLKVLSDCTLKKLVITSSLLKQREAMVSFAEIVESNHMTLRSFEWLKFSDSACEFEIFEVRTCSNNSSGDPSVLNLSMLRQLQTLTLGICIYEGSADEICEFLSTAPRNNKIESICFRCVYLGLPVEQAEHWVPLDTLLDSDFFGVLQKVTVVVLPCPYTGDRPPDSAIPDIQSFLPKLNSSGRLDVYTNGR